MSDISMCEYEQCEKSNSCRRFLDTPNPKWQSYSKFQNICSQSNNYEWFIQADEAIIKKGSSEDKENKE